MMDVLKSPGKLKCDAMSRLIEIHVKDVDSITYSELSR